MANSIHVQLADAIVAELNHASRSWYRKFTAVRTWTPWYKTEDEIAELHEKPKVAVVPLTLAVKKSSRNHRHWDYEIVIDVQRMFDLTGPDTSAAIDELDKICQDIQDFYNDAHTLMTGYLAMSAQREDVNNLALLHADSNWETMIAVACEGERS